MLLLNCVLCVSSVSASLKTHDRVELEAAIFATNKLCEVSGYGSVLCTFIFMIVTVMSYRAFASSACDEIAEMIQGITEAFTSL